MCQSAVAIINNCNVLLFVYVSACTCPAGEECTINGDCVCGNGTVRDGSSCIECDPTLGTYNLLYSQ